ncbi:hypothetical protein C2E23DRAFT_838671 [Lenzites betulinus]|nr:hypothetical protein C2E23DRAFT_838671 [Lenzites betulinus]
MLLSDDVKPVLRLRWRGLQADCGRVRCVLWLLLLLLLLSRLRNFWRRHGQMVRERELLELKLTRGHAFLLLLLLLLLLLEVLLQC